MYIGSKEFKNDIYIMGILNVTPDSFSDGNKFNNMESALRQTEKMVNEGATIIDVGGESTRPGYVMISDEEEINRTAPIIEKIKKEFDVAISIDTYKSKVAEAAIKAGADLVNDIHGLKYDKDMAKVVALHDASVCIMHNAINKKYELGTEYTLDKAKELEEGILEDLQESLTLAYNAGIDKDKIMIDPGIGFAKDYGMNMYMINNVDRLHKFDLPILMAASRKSVVGLALDLPVNDRLEGTLAITALSVAKGCNFVRVHDVKENKRVADMTYKILQYKKG